MSDESAVTESTGNAEVETPTPEDVVPEWVRKKLTEANNEAAKYRTRAKEAAEKAQFEAEEQFGTQIKTLTDEKAALAAELEMARSSATKLRAALSVGIPGESASEFADLLKGDTEEEIVAHATKLRELFGTPEKSTTRFVDKSQGLGNAAPANSEDAFGAFLMSRLTK